MRIVLLALAACCWLSHADAATRAAPPAAEPRIDMPPMRFLVVQSGSIGCPSDCARWISAEGKIVPETAAAFQNFLKQVGQRNLPVLIHSQGGSVSAAISIGRLIRARGFDVAVGRTAFTACAPGSGACPPSADGMARGEPVSQGAFCASACPLILAGGVRRFVGPDTMVGVHQITATQTLTSTRRSYWVTTTVTPTETFTDRRLLSETVSSRVVKLDKAPRSMMDQVRAHLRDMGISVALIDLMDSTPAESIRPLWTIELLQTGLATDLRGGGDLVANAVPTTARDLEARETVPMLDPRGDRVSVALDLVYRSATAAMTVIATPDRRDDSRSALFYPPSISPFSFGVLASYASHPGSLSGPTFSTFRAHDLCALRHFARVRLNFGATYKGTAIGGLPMWVDARRLFADRDFFAGLCQ